MSTTKGPISQRALVPELKALVDAAMAPNSTAHRDIARSRLRELLETTNWRTSFVCNNISSRRCKYIASLGYWVPQKWLLYDWKWPKPSEMTDDAE